MKKKTNSRSEKVKELETFLTAKQEPKEVENSPHTAEESAPIAEYVEPIEDSPKKLAQNGTNNPAGKKQEDNNQKTTDTKINNEALEQNVSKNEAENASKTAKEQQFESEITSYRKNLWSCFFKRFFDIVLSLLAIIILSPVLLIVSVIVFFKLDKKVFFSTYRSYRFGKNNKPFKLYKFSTMKNNLFDEEGNLLPDSERVSKFGNFLRKTSIDELPQLFNVLKGDMSLIGPRPRIIEECVFLDSESLRIRGLVRPGITGLAQINGRNNITFDKVVEFDKIYVQKISFWFDVKIFFKTIAKVFKRSDINKTGTVSNEFYGDMLLRVGQIEQDYYDKKINEAKEIINNVENRNG